MGNIRTVKSIKGFHQHKSPDLMLKLSFNSKFMMKYIIPMSFDKRKKNRKERRKLPNPKIYVIFWQKQKEKQFSLRVLRASFRLCVRHISFFFVRQTIQSYIVFCIYINIRSHSLPSPFFHRHLLFIYLNWVIIWI